MQKALCWCHRCVGTGLLTKHTARTKPARTYHFPCQGYADKITLSYAEEPWQHAVCHNSVIISIYCATAAPQGMGEVQDGDWLREGLLLYLRSLLQHHLKPLQSHLTSVPQFKNHKGLVMENNSRTASSLQLSLPVFNNILFETHFPGSSNSLQLLQASRSGALGEETYSLRLLCQELMNYKATSLSTPRCLHLPMFVV